MSSQNAFYLKRTADQVGLNVVRVETTEDDLGLPVYDLILTRGRMPTESYTRFRTVVMRKHRDARVEYYPDSRKIQVDLLDNEPPVTGPVPRSRNQLSFPESRAARLVRAVNQEARDEYGHTWKWDGDVKKCTRCGKYLGTSAADAPCNPPVRSRSDGFPVRTPNGPVGRRLRTSPLDRT